MRARVLPDAWPLVGFTVLVPAAAGALLWRAGGPGAAGLDPALPWVLGLLLAGGALAFLHARHRERARLVTAGRPAAWLAREAQLAGGLGLLVLLQITLGGGRSPAATVLAWLGLALALGLLGAICRLYMLRTVPAWRTWFTPVSLAGTGLLLGGMVVQLIRPRAAPGLALAGLAVALAVAQLVHLWRLGRGDGVGRESAAHLWIHHRGLLALRVGLALLGAGLLLAAPTVPATVPAAAILLTLAELAGRILFFAAHRRVGL
jgi:anaerobic dimethyl sulfoxide reductase subunit C (anchor subunit)